MEQITSPYNDTFFMKKAMQEAYNALDRKEIPVGCIIVINNKIIGKGHNLTQCLKDVTAHAEMQAITAASNYLDGKYLKDCTMYLTLEPCVMCAGALYWSQIKKIVVAAADTHRGYRNHGNLLHPKTTIEFGLMAEESEELLKQFFKSRRN